MNKLLTEDVKWCLERLPKCVIELMRERKKQVFVAGGFIRSCITNEKVNDVDIFAPSKDLAELYAQKLKGEFNLIETKNAYTITGGKFTLQIIHRWNFCEPQKCIDSFDFTIAKAIIWYDTEKDEKGNYWKSLCDDNYYADLSAKRLQYCSPERIEEVGGSMLRVLKFYQRGYRITLPSLAKVISRITTGVNKIDELTEEDLSFVLCGLLREVDPEVDPNNIGHL